MPFVKGKSGNPKGAPKKGERAKTHLLKHITEDQVAGLVAQGAFSGDKDMIKLCCEYFWGKPVQRNENDNIHTFPQGIEITFTKAKAKRDTDDKSTVSAGGAVNADQS